MIDVDGFIFESSKYKDFELVKELESGIRLYKDDTHYYFIELYSFISDKMWIEETECRIICSCVLYFDGIRHLYFGSKDGYIYYPNLTTLQEILNELKLIHNSEIQADKFL